MHYSRYFYSALLESAHWSIYDRYFHHEITQIANEAWHSFSDTESRVTFQPESIFCPYFVQTRPLCLYFFALIRNWTKETSFFPERRFFVNIIAHFCFVLNDIPFEWLNGESTRFVSNALHLLEIDMHSHVVPTSSLVRKSPKKSIIGLNVQLLRVCVCMSNAVKIVFNVKVISIQCRC